MNGTIAMCNLRARKQSAYEAVCTDFAVNHNMEKLAPQVGVTSGTILRNKLNPAQPHKLDPVDLVLLCKQSGDFSILNTLVSDLGVVIVPIPEGQEQITLLERFLKHSEYTGELSRNALEMCNANRLPRSQKRRTLAVAQAALGNLVWLIAELESQNAGLKPPAELETTFSISEGVKPEFV